MTTSYGVDTIIFKVLTITIVFLSPLGGVLVVISFMVFLDFLSKMLGFLYCGGIKNLKAEFKINRVTDTIIKVIGYTIILFAVRAITFYLDLALPMTKIIGSAIAISEIRSIDKNTYAVTGVSVWKILIEQVKRFIPGVFLITRKI